MATRDLPADFGVSWVPRKLAMTPLSAMRTPLKKPFSAQPGLANFTRLVLHVLYEASKTDSFWAPYLCTLPRRIPLPLYWDSDAILDMTKKPEMEKSARDRHLKSYW